MKKLLLTLLFAVSSAFASDADFYLGGIQVNENDHTAWVQSLESHGFNTVAVTIYAHQGDWDGSNLWYNENNESVINEIRTAKAAGLSVTLIMRVALDHAFPRNRFLWHGMIMPKTEADLDEWFRRYSDFVTGWAKKAQAEGVDIFGIGSEMRALSASTKTETIPALEAWYLDSEGQEREKTKLLKKKERPENLSDWFSDAKESPSLEAYLDERNTVWQNWAKQVAFQNSKDPVQAINARRNKLDKHWTSLIAKTRSVFKGKITYAANFDEFEEVQFWPHLDIMGVNAYFILRDKHLPTENEAQLQAALEEGWEKAFARMRKIQAARKVENQPVLFTELGYTFRKNSTLGPWASSGIHGVGQEEDRQFIIWNQEPFEFKERTAAVRALRKVSARSKPRLSGLLYWKLSTKPEHWKIEPFVHVIGDKKDEAFGKELSQFVSG